MRRISHTALLTYYPHHGRAYGDRCARGRAAVGVCRLQSAPWRARAVDSNFGAMAMEPVAAVAGIGASLQGFVSTLGGALVGALIGRQFNGTLVALAAGSLGCGLASLLFVLAAEKGKLFRGHHSGGGAALH